MLCACVYNICLGLTSHVHMGTSVTMKGGVVYNNYMCVCVGEGGGRGDNHHCIRYRVNQATLHPASMI